MAVDEAREQRAAAGVDTDLGVRVLLERDDPAFVDGQTTRVQPQLPGSVRAQVGQPGFRRRQQLSNALEGDHPSSIGTRSPCVRAASSACS